MGRVDAAPSVEDSSSTTTIRMAAGGDRSPSNIRLLCRLHNSYFAERDYGKDVMDQYRRSGSRVSESAPVYALAFRSPPEDELGVPSVPLILMRAANEKSLRRSSSLSDAATSAVAGSSDEDGHKHKHYAQ